MMALSGSFVPPLKGESPRHLVVMLHGLGAYGQDLIQLVPDFAQALPHAAFLAPDAPFACDMAPYGRQWFSLQDRRAARLVKGVETAGALLTDYLDRQLTRWNLADSKMVLLGFSQGAMLALWLAPRRQQACAGVVSFAGALVDGPGLSVENAVKPPVWLSHGARDLVVDPACQDHAAQELRRAGLTVTCQKLPDLGHEINLAGIKGAIGFLKQVLP